MTTPAALPLPAIREALAESDAYRALPPESQDEMARAMARVFGYFKDAPARQLGPGLDDLRGDLGGQGRPGGGGMQPGQPSPPAPQNGAPASGAGPSAFQRAGSATREMLGAVGFPDFAASLIQGTFQAIVDSSIQQMEAYANLLAETAKTVDAFMEDNISDDMARDHLVNNYSEVFRKDMSSGQPQMTVATDAVGAGQLPSFLRDLGFDSPLDIDAQAVDEVVIPQTRRTLAEMRHQSLATMVMMGINRIVVSDGEINAKLIFHVDATESVTLNFNDYKPTNWNLAGQLGGMGFGASGIVVNTTSLNTQNEVNMNAELTGEVRVRFRSDYFPLERFADSAAIQLINSHARVPDPRPTAPPQGQAQPGQPAVPGQPGAALPQPAPAPAPGNGPIGAPPPPSGNSGQSGSGS
jgi:hypothetical protein